MGKIINSVNKLQVEQVRKCLLKEQINRLCCPEKRAIYKGYICGHKSHIGQKKCFTPKYREKCIYFVLTEQTFFFYNEHLTHIKVYIF